MPAKPKLPPKLQRAKEEAEEKQSARSTLLERLAQIVEGHFPDGPLRRWQRKEYASIWVWIVKFQIRRSVLPTELELAAHLRELRRERDRDVHGH